MLMLRLIRKTSTHFLWLFLAYFLALTEAFMYEGFVKNNIGVGTTTIIPLLFFIFILHYWIKHKNLPSKSLIYKNLLLSLILIIFSWIGQFLNVLLYANFIYSKIHINPSVLIKTSGLLFFNSLLTLFISGYTKETIYIILSSLTGIFFVNKLNAYILANNSFNAFDEAISLLGHFYSTQGFVPYKDFGFPYAPLRILLLGKIIPFYSILQRNVFFSFLIILIFLFTFYLLKNLAKNKNNFLTISPIFLILTTTLLIDIPYEPLFFPLLFFYTAIGIFAETNKNKSVMLLIPVVAILLWLSNWQFSFFLALYEVLFFAAVILKKTKISAKIKRIFALKTTGHILGLVSLIVYLLVNSAIKEGYMFMLDIHRKAMKYRYIPLPNISSPFSQDNFFYLTIFLIVALSSKFLFNKVKNLKTGFYILFLPTIALPYALGRSDWPHLFPIFKIFLFSTILLFLLNYLSEKEIILISILSIFPLHTLIFATKPTLLPTKKEQVVKQMDEALKDCKEKSKKVAYKSIFVTKSSYEGYKGVSNSALYLINPKVPPAGKFIHEEVNVHSDCKYGEIITSYLNKAPKPILTFVEKKELNPPLTSCGKIETWLKTRPYEYINTCKSLDSSYEIRLYK